MVLKLTFDLVILLQVWPSVVGISKVQLSQISGSKSSLTSHELPSGGDSAVGHRNAIGFYDVVEGLRKQMLADRESIAIDAAEASPSLMPDIGIIDAETSESDDIRASKADAGNVDKEIGTFHVTERNDFSSESIAHDESVKPEGSKDITFREGYNETKLSRSVEVSLPKEYDRENATDCDFSGKGSHKVDVNSETVDEDHKDIARKFHGKAGSTLEPIGVNPAQSTGVHSAPIRGDILKASMVYYILLALDCFSLIAFQNLGTRQ